MTSDLDTLCGRVLANRYCIRQLLGRGGMGSVFEALDRRLDRTVAVKVIAPLGEPSLRRGRLRARFLREARAAACLQHPNVVTVHDFGMDEPLGLEFLVMERLHGDDLASRFKRFGVLSPQEVYELLKGALRGVAAGHQAGIVHRDLKPANLFIVDGDHALDQRVRVLDFGIAQRRSADRTVTRLTVTGHAPLTPSYASPEQLRGEADLIPATDVFSLAATATRLLTGQCVFTPAERDELAEGGVLSARGPASIDPGVPVDLDRALRRALVFDPRQRFNDAAEFLEAVEAIRPSFSLTRAGGSAGSAVRGRAAPLARGEESPGAAAQARTRTAVSRQMDSHHLRGTAETTQSRRHASTSLGNGRPEHPPPPAPGGLEPVESGARGRRRRLLIAGSIILGAGLVLPVLGSGAVRALETGGWGLRQTGKDAMEQCTRLYEAAHEAANPAWRAVARACGRAYASGELGFADQITALQRRVGGLRASGQLLDAERAAREWVQLQPAEMEPYQDLGEILHRRGQLDEALWAYRQAQEHSPRDALLSFRAGQVLIEMGRLRDALQEFEQARRLDPAYEDTWEFQHQLAGLLFQLRDWEASLHAHRRVTDLNPAWADGWGNLALAAHLLGHHKEAVEAYSRALRADPRFFETRPDQRDFWQKSLRRVL